MTAVERVLREYMEAWEAGRRPDLDAYLARVDPGEQDELAALIGEWLMVAPTPAYSEETLAQIAQEPLLVAAREQVAFLRRPVAERLPELRERAGLSIRDLAAQVVARFRAGTEQRAAALLEDLEGGQLDDRRLSRRLLDGLAGILGADPALLSVEPTGAGAPAAALWRAEDGVAASMLDLDALSRASLADAPEPMDELDRLFLGGPSA